MKKWTTTIRAIKPLTGELVNWCGPNIEAPSWKLAQEWCENNGLGYCLIDGELIAEIPTKADGVTPDWRGMIDYEAMQNN